MTEKEVNFLSNFQGICYSPFVVICYFLVDKQLNISTDTIIALVLAKAPGVAAEFKFLRSR